MLEEIRKLVKTETWTSKTPAAVLTPLCATVLSLCHKIVHACYSIMHTYNYMKFFPMYTVFSKVFAIVVLLFLLNRIISSQMSPPLRDRAKMILDVSFICFYDIYKLFFC